MNIIRDDNSETFFKCPSCERVRRRSKTPEYQRAIRHDDYVMTEDMKERLTGLRCLDCDRTIESPNLIVRRPAWCNECGGVHMLAGRRGLRKEPRPKPLKDPIKMALADISTNDDID